MEIATSTLVGYWIAAFLTLCIFSFLYKDNPFYKFAEHLFVGVSTGYGVVLQFYDVLLPNLFEPLVKPGELGGFWLVYAAAVVLSLMMFAKFSKNFGWLARWPLAFVVGTFAGVNIIGFASGDLVLQVQANMLPLVAKGAPWWTSANNILSVVGLCCALLYFFFSRPHTGALGVASRIGIYFMMVSFGASFGYTVMGRLALAIGRAQDLIYETPDTPTAPWPGIVSLLVIGIGLVILERMGKLKTPEEIALEEEAREDQDAQNSAG